MPDFAVILGADGLNQQSPSNPVFIAGGPISIDQAQTGGNEVAPARPYPARARLANAGSGNAANASAAATINGIPGLTFYLTKATFLAGGATAALAVASTLTGLLGGTRTYGMIFSGTVGVATTYDFNFNPPLPSIPGVNVVGTLPAGGSGNTAASVNLEGYYL